MRPATAADACAYYGRDIPWPWFGLAAEREGVVVGLAGVVWREDGAFVFLDCAQRWMPPAMHACRLARHMLRLAHAAGETEIRVVPTPGVATAKKWLTMLGFRFERHDATYGEVWKSCRD